MAMVELVQSRWEQSGKNVYGAVKCTNFEVKKSSVIFIIFWNSLLELVDGCRHQLLKKDVTNYIHTIFSPMNVIIIFVCICKIFYRKKIIFCQNEKQFQTKFWCKMLSMFGKKSVKTVPILTTIDFYNTNFRQKCECLKFVSRD